MSFTTVFTFIWMGLFKSISVNLKGLFDSIGPWSAYDENVEWWVLAMIFLSSEHFPVYIGLKL